jgi:hypothetical protein
VLDLREALKTTLGASFTVNHTGPGGAVVVTVSVIDAGRGDEAALPLVAIMSQAGTGTPSNIGGKAVRNDAFCDLSIETLDADDVYGPTLLKDIHAKVETLIRAAEKTLGSSYYSLVSSYRDMAPSLVGAAHVYRRLVTVRAVNYEAY